MQDWTRTTVRDAMTSPVVALESGTTIRRAIERLTEEEFHGAPVVAEDGRAIGVVSLLDLVAYIGGPPWPRGRLGSYYAQIDETTGRGIAGSDAPGREQRLDETAVDDVMTQEVIGVESDATLPDVVALMRRHRIHRVLVLSEGVPVGIVSTMDVLAVLAGETRSFAGTV